MTTLGALGAILAALLLGAMSPGPSFVLVARNAVGLSRGDGLATAAGMGAGGMLFSLLAVLGLYSLLATVGWLYAILKAAGGAYLLYLAWQIWRGAPKPLVMNEDALEAQRSLLRSFRTGLGTQLTNPKTALVYGSIFAALLPARPPFWITVALPVLVFCVEAGWYGTVALCFSSKAPRALYLRSKTLIDRFAAVAVGALGLRLLTTAEGN
ncbi:LysE family translocator [Massilia endophytica]|uniref:LysE family translocator n=1 Tax=Massilia endophytica TaxID=2899220 RepID=UPI001E5E8F2B|nr:LysE family transporter [Massilia endophytica]UGQ46715.1 LysE family transporter [Massilia endophytica]